MKYTLKSATAVASHKGSRSESPGQSPPKVGHLSAEGVEKQTMERRAGILGQRGPVAAEVDEEGDVIPNSFASLACARRTGVF
jgi:hypothetical protein